MASSESPIHELSVADKLDNEISKLRDQVSSLKRHLNLHTTTLLTSPATQSLISTTAAADDDDQDSINPVFPSKKKPRQKSKTSSTPTAAQRLAQNPKIQTDLAAHHQRNLYRACATATTFRARDPDPCAVDEGRILGLRIEVMTGASFLRAFFVLLNRPYYYKEGAAAAARGKREEAKKALRIHRHTIPPCIPLSGLAARWLPAPPPPPSSAKAKGNDEEEEEDDDDDDDEPKKQDLARFVRALRRELVRYQNRVAAVGDLRKAAGIGEGEEEEEEEEEGAGDKMIDISVADPEARHVRLEWRDGRTGRMVLGDGGEVRKVVVQGENGRDRAMARRLMMKGEGENDQNATVRVEDLVGRLERGEV